MHHGTCRFRSLLASRKEEHIVFVVTADWWQFFAQSSRFLRSHRSHTFRPRRRTRLSWSITWTRLSWQVHQGHAAGVGGVTSPVECNAASASAVSGSRMKLAPVSDQAKDEEAAWSGGRVMRGATSKWKDHRRKRAAVTREQLAALNSIFSSSGRAHAHFGIPLPYSASSKTHWLHAGPRSASANCADRLSGELLVAHSVYQKVARHFWITGRPVMLELFFVAPLKGLEVGDEEQSLADCFQKCAGCCVCQCGSITLDRAELKKVNFVAASRPDSPIRPRLRQVDWRQGIVSD